MTQNKKVKIDNEMIEYQINYKDIKKIYLRVEEGVIKISAPNLCPIELIENIIKDNYDKIKDKIINYKPYFEYRDNGFVYIFNKRYSIQLIDLKYKKAFFKKNKIIVYDQNIQKVIETELNKYLLNYLNDLVKKYCKIDSRFPLPKIELKKQKEDMVPVIIKIIK